MGGAARTIRRGRDLRLDGWRVSPHIDSLFAVAAAACYVRSMFRLSGFWGGIGILAAAGWLYHVIPILWAAGR